MADTRVQMPASESLKGWLGERCQRMDTGTERQLRVGRQASIELDIWRAVLAAELRRIRLTRSQALFLGHVVGPVPLDGAAAAVGMPLVYARAAEVLALPAADGIMAAEEYGLDAEALLAYLYQLGPAADHALHQALANWYAQGADLAPAAWARVGLHVREDHTAVSVAPDIPQGEETT